MKRRSLLFGSVLTLCVSPLCANADAAKPSGTVYLLLPDAVTIRFVKFDTPNIIAAFRKYAPGITVKVLNANNRVADQVSDMDAALASDAKGIILVPTDPSQSGGLLARAAADKVPVVTYAHDPGPGPIAYHVSVSFTDIGKAQGQWLTAHLPAARPVKLAYMLGDPKFTFYGDQMKGFDEYVGPLIKNGTVTVVCRADAMLYNPANAQRNMEQCLTKTNNAVDGAVVMNDDTGGGVEAALTAQGLEGKVELYGGYDATLEGVQRVLAGWQAADMAPPYKQMADAAAQLMIAAMTGAAPPPGLINGHWDNHFVKGGVPAALLPNIFITPENVQQTVVEAGLYDKAELCKGIASKAPFCAKK